MAGRLGRITLIEKGYPGILAGESHQQLGRHVPQIDIEMGHPLRHDNGVSGAQRVSEELVAVRSGSSEPREHVSPYDDFELGATWMEVWREKAAGSVKTDGRRNSHRVHTRA